METEKVYREKAARTVKGGESTAETGMRGDLSAINWLITSVF